MPYSKHGVRRPIGLWSFTALSLSLWLSTGLVDHTRAQTPCASELAAAEREFHEANFDEALAQADRCLKQSGLPVAAQLRAYRVQAMVYQARDDAQQARETVRAMLRLASDYQPDPEQDYPGFVDLVEQVRAEEQRTTPVALPSPPAAPDSATASQKKRRGMAKWFLLGGGAGVAALTVAILAGGNTKNGAAPTPQSLPTPPPLP
ncbi:MAG: hypothetical protein DKINENOH_00910 [bacterium]|nr:hypothetical protein [bacterium]